MRIITVYFFLIIVCGCDTESQENPNSSAAAPQVNVTQWIHHISKDKTFEVDFPSAPEPWKNEGEMPDYGQTDFHYLTSKSSGMMFGVNYNDYPRDLTDFEVDSELKNAYTLPDTGAQILATSEVPVADIPAIEVISKTGPIYMVGRFFISDARRLYSLQVGSTRDVRGDRKAIDRFFNSFQLEASADQRSPVVTK